MWVWLRAQPGSLYRLRPQGRYCFLLAADGWSEMERDGEGRLVGDRARFPSGMAALGKYIHSKGEGDSQ